MGLNPALRLWAAKKPPAAGITFPITGVTNSGTSASPSFTLGTPPATDDYIFVFVQCGGASVAVTDPSDWPNVLGTNTIVTADTCSASGFYHKVTSGESGSSTVTWTFTNLYGSNPVWRCTAIVLRGVDTASPLSGTPTSSFNNGNTTTPWLIPTITPGDDNSQIVSGVGGDGTETQSTPGGWTLRASANATITAYCYSRDALGSSGVATGTTNVTPSTGNEYTSIAVCFKPA